LMLLRAVDVCQGLQVDVQLVTDAPLRVIN